MRRAVIASVLVAGCFATPTPPELDPGLSDLAVVGIHPAVLLPGSTVDVVGVAFVPRESGLPFLHVTGTFTPPTGEPRPIDTELPALWVDATHLRVPSGTGVFAALGGEAGGFSGSAYVAIDSAVDRQRHVSEPIEFQMGLERTIRPVVDVVDPKKVGSYHVNDGIELQGKGFLLGDAEGDTRVSVTGCFLPQGAPEPCYGNGVTIKNAEVVARPSASWDRDHAVFPFAPSIVGIHPGKFTGKLKVRNVVKGNKQTSCKKDLDCAPGSVCSAESICVPPESFYIQFALNVLPPEIKKFNPGRASLGQFVDVSGGGFVGGAAGSVTLVKLSGNYKPETGTTDVPVEFYLLPRFVSGNLLRYVIDETDELGHLLDLRRDAGTFTGTATPIVRLGKEEEVGAPRSVTLGVDHVKQVIHLNFEASYVDSLQLFGLYNADQAIRERVMTVANRDYQGINAEWRFTEPTDFALYARVDILGPDPNNLDLLGYDNTPGKDVDNSRLYDRIGGVNASTQQDGFPGYGGVFAEQFLGFSRHPPSVVGRLPFETEYFDRIFDPLRIDQGGIPATGAEAATVPRLTEGTGCPSGERRMQVACAIFVLGNMIGTTLTHELGHSLGLANPYGDGFHDIGDLPSRLMESGSDRPFEERAELNGQGPARFCTDEFSYLKAILPSTTPSSVERPPCE